MPGSEFRLLPRLPLEYKTYKIISPATIGKAMTEGWIPVAAINYEERVKDQSFLTTRFLIGKEMRAGAQAMRGAGPTPIIMFPQPESDEEPETTTQVQQLLDRLAQMSPEEVLALHAELQQQQKAQKEDLGDLDEDEDEDEGEMAEVSAAMDELLDDGTEDDDE